MTDKEYFKHWASPHVCWTDWVRPVIFLGMSALNNDSSSSTYTIPSLHAFNTLSKDTAIMVDLPTYDGVLEGLAYASLGYRPIPLYNGTQQQRDAMALVDNTDIQRALVWGTTHLHSCAIEPDAPPVFMIDTNRMLRFKMNASVFDNSWDLYHQDIPSVEYFKQKGIRKIVIHTEKLQRDLIKIFYEFQKKGIAIYQTDGFTKPRRIVLKKPPKKDKFH